MRGPHEKVKLRAKERSEGGVWVLSSSVGVPWPSEILLILLFDSEIRMVRTEHASSARTSARRAVRELGGESTHRSKSITSALCVSRLIRRRVPSLGSSN